jgi:hypothetical protein
MTAAEIEQAVYEREEVRIVIRAPSRAVLGDYTNVRAAPGTASVAEWLAQRILPQMVGQEVVVIDGNGAIPHGRTRMATLRASYER